MIDDFPAELAKVNGPGLAALREYLSSGQAVAFLGSGVSAPLYPSSTDLTSSWWTRRPIG